MRLAVTSTRSAEAIGLACFTATTCQACRGPTTNSKAASVTHGAAYCGPRAKRALHSARSNAKARGNSSRTPQQRPRYSMPCVKHHWRSWCKKGSVLLRIANASACKAAPSNRLKLNSTNYVSNGRRYNLQAQGDFRGIADRYIVWFAYCVSFCLAGSLHVLKVVEFPPPIEHWLQRAVQPKHCEES